MANVSSTTDASDAWRGSSNRELAKVLRVNPRQMLNLLRSTMMCGADAKDITHAVEANGGPKNYIPRNVLPMVPWRAINAPTNTTLKGLTQLITKVIPPQNPANAVVSPGVWIIVDKPWCGSNVRSYAEISVDSNVGIPLAYASVLDANNYPVPTGTTQIQFGHQTQLKTGQTGPGWLGVYGIPSLMTPPPRVVLTGGLPPYSQGGALGWSSANGYLFDPGRLYPKIPNSATASATFNAIMVLRCGKDQPQSSENLAALYSQGRKLTSLSNFHITANAAGTSATGQGAAAFITNVTLPTFSQAVLESQGANNSVSQIPLVHMQGEPRPGVRMMLGTNVQQNLQFLDVSAVSGGLAAVATNLYSTLIGASGLDMSIPTSSCTVPQSQAISGALDVMTVANGVYDMQRDGYARVLWVSTFFASDATFTKSPELLSTACQVAGGAGNAINNTYNKTIFSTATNANGGVRVPVTQVELPQGNEDSPVQFELSWKVGMGAGQPGSLGSGCHVWIQADSDDTVQFKYTPFGLGQFGVDCASAQFHTQGAYGVIPGGTLTEPRCTIKTPMQPDGYSATRQWTWAGMFLALSAMPNAQQQFNMDVYLPLENQSGVTGPAYVARIDGISSSQQLVYQQRSQWEVLANAATRAVDNRSGNMYHPMISPRFPDLLRDLFASNGAAFFKTILDEDSWSARVYQLEYGIRSVEDFVDLLRNQEFIHNPSDELHETMQHMLITTPAENGLKEAVKDQAEHIKEVEIELDQLKRSREEDVETAQKQSRLEAAMDAAIERMNSRLDRLDRLVEANRYPLVGQGVSSDGQYGVGGEGGQYGVGNADRSVGAAAVWERDNENYFDSTGSNNSTQRGEVSVTGHPWLNSAIGGFSDSDDVADLLRGETVISEFQAETAADSIRFGFLTAYDIVELHTKLPVDTAIDWQTVYSNLAQGFTTSSHKEAAFWAMCKNADTLTRLRDGAYENVVHFMQAIDRAHSMFMTAAANERQLYEKYTRRVFTKQGVEEQAALRRLTNLPTEQYLCVAMHDPKNSRHVERSVILPGSVAHKLLRFADYTLKRRLAQNSRRDFEDWKTKHPAPKELTVTEITDLVQRAHDFWFKHRAELTTGKQRVRLPGNKYQTQSDANLFTIVRETGYVMKSHTQLGGLDPKRFQEAVQGLSSDQARALRESLRANEALHTVATVTSDKPPVTTRAPPPPNVTTQQLPLRRNF